MGMTCARIGWSVDARPWPIMRNSRARRLTAFQPLRRCRNECDIPRSPSITTQPRYLADDSWATGGESGSNGIGAPGIGNRRRGTQRCAPRSVSTRRPFVRTKKGRPPGTDLDERERATSPPHRTASRFRDRGCQAVSAIPDRSRSPRRTRDAGPHRRCARESLAWNLARRDPSRIRPMKHFIWEPAARLDLRRLDRETAMRILQALTRYGESGEGDIKMLTDRAGLYRLRVGKWRIFFDLDSPSTVRIHGVDNRGQPH